MTGIWRKKQGFGPETKMRDTYIAYNPVAFLPIKFMGRRLVNFRDAGKFQEGIFKGIFNTYYFTVSGNLYLLHLPLVVCMRV